MKKIPPQQLQHEPVLLGSVLKLLKPKKGESFLDLTAGYGGHSGAIVKETNAPNQATLVDRDENSIKALQPLKEQGASLIKSDFFKASSDLIEAGKRFDMILIDLGVSSPQLDIPDRGFSFTRPGPLDMRMDQTSGQTAEEFLNQVKEDKLKSILRDFGEEPKAKQIAEAIIEARPIKTTDQLAGIVETVYRGRRSKTHPATRTFQAIRIAINDELGQLQKTLPLILQLLKSGGRVAIISFHSLEDRLVKRFFKDQAESGYEATIQLLTKRPISGADEDVNNPRSRSAKLRGAVKIKI